MTWFIQQYLPEAMDLKTPEASVLFEVLVGLLPTVLLVAGFDPSVTRTRLCSAPSGSWSSRD